MHSSLIYWVRKEKKNLSNLFLPQTTFQRQQFLLTRIFRYLWIHIYRIFLWIVSDWPCCLSCLKCFWKNFNFGLIKRCFAMFMHYHLSLNYCQMGLVYKIQLVSCWLCKLAIHFELLPEMKVLFVMLPYLYLPVGLSSLRT